MKKTYLLAAALGSAILSAHADDSRFINRKAEGWFWYETAPEEPEPVVEPEPEIVAIEQTAEPAPEPTAKQGPAPLSAAWFRKNLGKYKDAAWDNPTLENLQAYLYLQRFAMDRSEQFADVAEMAVTGNPLLDEMSRRPTATFGSQKVDQVAGRLRDEAVSKLAESVGVFFFYDEEDEYSTAMAPLVKLLEMSNFTIMAISESGEPIPGHEHDFNYRADAGHAEQLGITTLPALFLASPEGQFASIGQGLMSMTDMTNRMLVVAKREGWITDEQFNKTKPLTSYDNIAEMLTSRPATGGQADAITQNADPENDNFVAPEQLLKFIKEKTRGSYAKELSQ